MRKAQSCDPASSFSLERRSRPHPRCRDLLWLPWLNILVEAKEVCWIVSPFQMAKATVLFLPVCASRHSTIRLLVYIVGFEGMCGEPAGRAPAPGDRRLVVIRTVPGTLRNPIEGAVSARIRRRVLLDIADGSTELQAIDLDP